MIVKELHLQNFRCFTDAKISFDERLTVFVGKNGSGKTALLDAVAIALNQYILPSYQIHSKKNTGHKKGKTTKLAIDSAIYDIFDTNYTISKDDKTVTASPNDATNISSLLLEGFQDVKVSAYAERAEIQDNILRKANEPPQSLNVYVYYPAIRMTKDKDIFFDQENGNQLKGSVNAYRNCFQPTLSFADTFAWIDAHDAEEARRFRDGEPDYRDPELSAMREAVEKALPEFTGLRFKGTTKEILLVRKSDGQKLSFWQLSDGYRAMLALILDLARRMALINGKQYTQEGRSILESPAIVLIDEVELHLHPGWQQTVLPSLLEIFPNTQFIVTTHSPQVLSSIKPHNIRLLDGGRCIPYEGSTYGAESSRILEEVFGISLRADTPARAALDAYLKLVQNGDYGSPQALELRQKLDAWLYGDPILDSADMLIRRAERQKAREAGRA